MRICVSQGVVTFVLLMFGVNWIVKALIDLCLTGHQTVLLSRKTLHFHFYSIMGCTNSIFKAQFCTYRCTKRTSLLEVATFRKENKYKIHKLLWPSLSMPAPSPRSLVGLTSDRAPGYRNISIFYFREIPPFSSWLFRVTACSLSPSPFGKPSFPQFSEQSMNLVKYSQGGPGSCYYPDYSVPWIENTTLLHQHRKICLCDTAYVRFYSGG